MTKSRSQSGGRRSAGGTEPAARRREAQQVEEPSASRPGVRRELVENEMYAQASRLFAERGFAGTSLQDIAEAMGMTRPALYYYVKSKDELLAKLVTEITEGNAAEIRSVVESSDIDAVTKLRKIARLLAFLRATQPARFLLLERSEAELPSGLADVHESAKRSVLHDLMRVIEEGVAKGQFRPVDPRVAALAVIGMCNWVAWWHHPGTGRNEADIAEQLADLAVAMVVQASERTPTVSGPRAALALLRQDLQYLDRTLGPD